MSDYSIVPNAALTATADAIRTKSGSQATIGFDHNTGFADAVDAIPTGGGGTHSASGNIVIPQNIVVSQSGTPTVLFPGLQLPFVPDYLVLWIDREDYEAGANATTTPFIEVTRKHDTYPPFRFSNTVSHVSMYENEDYFFRITSSRGVSTDPSVSGGYGISSSILALINLTSSPGWAVNSNGTLTVGTSNTGNDLTISAATWHYYALKG